MPSHAVATPKEPRKAGSTAVAISWLQSLKREASAIPSTVRFSHDRTEEEGDRFMALGTLAYKAFLKSFYASRIAAGAGSRGRFFVVKAMVGLKP
jgi:hypothetical protein